MFKFSNFKTLKNSFIIFNLKFIIFSLALAGFVFLIKSDPALANMESENYELQMPNLNYAAGNVNSALFKLGFTGGELAVGPYSSTGFKLGAGFWYLKTIIPFAFTVSNNVIEFAILSANTPSTATTNLIVSAGGAGGYQVTTQENHEMMVYSVGALIKDVTGDNTDITETAAGEWLNTNTYGFGYSLYGDDVVSPFPNNEPTPPTYFKQFANLAKNETPQVIMSSSRVGKNRTATVIYKINISAIQAAGRYQNVITYIATPTY